MIGGSRSDGNELRERTDELDARKLLSGRYEQQLVGDLSLEEQVPDIGYNAIYRRSQIHEPIVDERYLANGGRRPSWPNDADFAVCLTHDVDEVSYFSVRQYLRGVARDARLQEGSPATAKLLLKRAGVFLNRLRKQWRRPDPYHCYERWLEVEESVGARSTFFFMPEDVRRPHPTDPSYEYSDTVTFDGEERTVAEMMRTIDRRGWEIGLHPTWYAYRDPEVLADQKAQIERVLGHEITSVRQHNLHYDVTRTPRAHAEAGFEFDSTLGFNNGVGFRFGTSYPWQLFDLASDERLPILELPLIAQDGALLNPNKGLTLDESTAFSYLVQLADEVEEVGGVLTLNWHPRFAGVPSWWNLYTRVLEHLRARDAWFGSVEEIGNWWMDNGFNVLR